MKILLCGEAWGEKEEEARRPFVGALGWLLDQMLGHAGISRADCYTTNVFNLRPRPSNDIKNLCGPKSTALPGFPELDRGKYVRAEFAPELDRLYQEVRDVNPNLIVALGATAAWAFLHTSGIKAIRGAIAPSHWAVSQRLGRQYKILPTYHPAMVLRDYSARPVATADLTKAKREGEFSEVRRPKRLIWTTPTIADLVRYDKEYIEPAAQLACDIETVGDQVTCIGFSPSPDSCLVIPFFRGVNQNYWPDLQEEIVAWGFVRKWLREKPCIFQNGLYDLSFLWKNCGIGVAHDTEDTMLLHHAYMPELPKGLGFLATIYTDEASWKFMRKGLRHD